MRVTYDELADAAYIYLLATGHEGNVKHTYTCGPNVVNGQVNLDFDEEGHLIGIEVLDAGRLLPREVLRQAEKL